MTTSTQLTVVDRRPFSAWASDQDGLREAMREAMPDKRFTPTPADFMTPKDKPIYREMIVAVMRVGIPMRASEIAKLVNVKRSSLYGAMGQLEEAGRIKKIGNSSARAYLLMSKEDEV